MASLVSPGVSVSVIDSSAYASNAAVSIPLIYIATADEKTQSDGTSPALGTYEHGVIREVTSIKQAIQLYGIPRYLTSEVGEAFHGDARNEYGLDALCKALEISSRAYVVRANVNLDDGLDNIKNLWENKTQDASNLLNVNVQNYIEQYNEENGLVPSDLNYKETVNASELKTLVEDSLVDVFDSYSFSSQNFQNGFVQDHSIPHAGYQDVLFDTTGGYLQLSDTTGLVSVETYGADVEVVDGSGTVSVHFEFLGSDAITFGDLISEMNTTLGTSGTVQLLNGILRIESSLAGATSSVTVITDGPSGTLPLFASLNLYKSIDSSVPGTGAQSLNMYDSTYTTVVGSYDGLDSLIDDWVSGNTVPDEFTSDEAEGLLLAASTDYETTKEFKQYTSLGANDAARRAAIVKQLQAVVNDPTVGVTSEQIEYNITVCPGYWELTDELVRLSQDVRSEVFVIGETPFNKAPTGPEGIGVWATTTDRINNYLDAYWYGHGISSNIDGSDIMTTAASTALRTLLYSDTVSEVWYAPAGTSRGTCPHLTDLGYVQGTLGGPTDFVSNYLDQGTRDSLYEFPKNINPITYIPGRGILVFGQKTSSPVTSALDRINVSRLICYMRRAVRKAVFPFLFEPDDKTTWDNAKYVVDSFCSTLAQRRGLTDWLVVCDSSNNTNETIDNNELHIDIYIVPTKSVEFILIPITIENTGTDLSSLV